MADFDFFCFLYYYPYVSDRRKTGVKEASTTHLPRSKEEIKEHYINNLFWRLKILENLIIESNKKAKKLCKVINYNQKGSNRSVFEWM